MLAFPRQQRIAHLNRLTARPIRLPCQRLVQHYLLPVHLNGQISILCDRRLVSTIQIEHQRVRLCPRSDVKVVFQLPVAAVERRVHSRINLGFTHALKQRDIRLPIRLRSLEPCALGRKLFLT